MLAAAGGLPVGLITGEPVGLTVGVTVGLSVGLTGAAGAGVAGEEAGMGGKDPKLTCGTSDDAVEALLLTVGAMSAVWDAGACAYLLSGEAVAVVTGGCARVEFDNGGCAMEGNDTGAFAMDGAGPVAGDSSAAQKVHSHPLGTPSTCGFTSIRMLDFQNNALATGWIDISCLYDTQHHMHSHVNACQNVGALISRWISPD